MSLLGPVMVAGLLLAATEPLAVAVVPADTATSIMPGICNLAVVKGLRPGRTLTVRNGPSLRHHPIDALAAGQRVYTCNSSREWIGNDRHEWLGVVYAGSGFPCDGGGSDGLDIRLAGRCRSGWVSGDWIEILSG